MDDILEKLREILQQIELEEQKMHYDNLSMLFEIKSRLRVYVGEYFKDKDELEELMYDLDFDNIQSQSDYEMALHKLKAVVNAMIEYVKISSINKLTREDSRIDKMMRELELRQEKLEKNAKEIDAIKEKLYNDKQDFIQQEEKYNNLKQRMEVAEKSIDFHTQSNYNFSISIFWMALTTIAFLILLYILYDSVNDYTSFSRILRDLKEEKLELSKELVYFSFGKFILGKIVFISIIIYALRICVKNYNAQMHNYIINRHKANSFKSALSLLDTAKSEEGNDKLLIQATQAIFSHQDTGYGKTDFDENNVNIITSLTENISKKI